LEDEHDEDDVENVEDGEDKAGGVEIDDTIEKVDEEECGWCESDIIG
jgi:hypothetical protein